MAEEKPESHISIEQCNWGSTSPTSQLKNGVYIVPQNGEIYFLVTITSTKYISGVNTSFSITNVTGISRFDIINDITSSVSSPGPMYGSDGATGIGWDYGRGFDVHVTVPNEVTYSNSATFTPNAGFRVSLDNYPDEYVDVSLCRKGLYIVVEEFRRYAIFDASVTGLGSGKFRGVDQTLSNALTNDPNYTASYAHVGSYSYLLNPIFYKETTQSGGYSSWNWTDKTLPVCEQAYNYVTDTLLGNINLRSSEGPLDMGFNQMLAFKVRTNCPYIRFIEQTGSTSYFHSYGIYASTNSYGLSASMHESTGTPSNPWFAAQYDTGVDGECHYWVAIKGHTYNVSDSATIPCEIRGGDTTSLGGSYTPETNLGDVTYVAVPITVVFKAAHILKIRCKWRLYLHNSWPTADNTIFNHWKKTLLTFSAEVGTANSAAGGTITALAGEDWNGEFKSVDLSNAWGKTKDQEYNCWGINAAPTSSLDGPSKEFGVIMLAKMNYTTATRYIRLIFDSSVDSIPNPNPANTSSGYHVDVQTYGAGKSASVISFTKDESMVTSGGNTFYRAICRGPKGMWTNSTTTGSNTSYMMNRYYFFTYIIDFSYDFPGSWSGNPVT